MFLLTGFTELWAEVFSMAMSHAGMCTDKERAPASHDGDAAAVAGEELMKFVIESAVLRFVALSTADDVVGAAVKRAIDTSDVVTSPPKASTLGVATVHTELLGMAATYVEQIVGVAVATADDAAAAADGIAATLVDAIMDEAIDVDAAAADEVAVDMADTIIRDAIDDAAAAADEAIALVDAIMENATTEPEETWVVVDSAAANV